MIRMDFDSVPIRKTCHGSRRDINSNVPASTDV